MKSSVWFALTVGLAACGGGNENTGPVTPPPSATTSTSPTSATTSSTGTTAEPPKPTLAELHMKLGMSIQDAWMKHDTKAALANYSPDAVMGFASFHGWEDAKIDMIEKRLGAFWNACPDVKLGALRVYEKNEIGIVEWIAAGTNTGDMMGEKATGKKFGNHGITLYWMDKTSGKIARENMYMDEATFMGQLGKADKNAKFRSVEDVPSAKPEMIMGKDGDDTTKNEAAAKAIYDAFNKHDATAFLGTITDDAVHADYAQPADTKGKDAAKKEVGEFLKAFPDLKLTPKNTWAMGDYVIVEGEMFGTMKGPIGPFKPTGKSATTHFVDVMKFNKDAKATWVATYSNGLEMGVQYGLIKPPAMPKGDAKPADAKPTDVKKPDAKPATTTAPPPKK